MAYVRVTFLISLLILSACTKVPREYETVSDVEKEALFIDKFDRFNPAAHALFINERGAYQPRRFKVSQIDPVWNNWKHYDIQLSGETQKLYDVLAVFETRTGAIQYQTPKDQQPKDNDTLDEKTEEEIHACNELETLLDIEKVTADFGDNGLNCHLNRIIAHLMLRNFIAEKTGRELRLQIFIHGGLNGPDEHIKRLRENLPIISCFNGHLDKHTFKNKQTVNCKLRVSSKENSYNENPTNYDIYPLFISWPSDFPSTYFDSLFNYNQGDWDTLSTLLQTPYKVIGNVGEIVVRAPLNYFKSYDRMTHNQSEAFGIGANKGLCTLQKKLSGKNGKKFKDNLFKNITDEDEQEMLNFIQNAVFCDRQGDRNNRIAEWTKYLATSPVRILSVPLIDPIGLESWNSMISRARFAFRKPRAIIDSFNYYDALASHETTVSNTDYKENDLQGAIAKLLVKLGDAVKKERLENVKINLIGHSMGAIIAGDILRDYQELPYENIVFMGAASTVRDYRNTIQPALQHMILKEKRDIHFYNLMLHPYAESREFSVHGLAPAGSLLEWIDHIYNRPDNDLDRTLGKWHNVLSAIDIFDPELDKNITLKRFGLKAAPLTHGSFSDPQLNPDVRTCNDGRKREWHYAYYNPTFWQKSSACKY